MQHAAVGEARREDFHAGKCTEFVAAAYEVIPIAVCSRIEGNTYIIVET